MKYDGLLFRITLYIRTYFAYPSNLALYPNKVRVYIYRSLVELLRPQSSSPPFICKLSSGLPILSILMLLIYVHISVVFKLLWFLVSRVVVNQNPGGFLILSKFDSENHRGTYMGQKRKITTLCDTLCSLWFNRPYRDRIHQKSEKVHAYTNYQRAQNIRHLCCTADQLC